MDREEGGGSGSGSPEGEDGRGPSRRMKELSASEIMHIGGNKDQTGIMDENFDQYMMGGQDESNAVGYEQEEEGRQEDSGEYHFSPTDVKCEPIL